MRRTERRYSEEKISQIKNRLDSLEEKFTGKTRDEVVCDLEKNIKKAIGKGYSLKEISDILAEEEMYLPVGFLKNHFVKSPKRKKAVEKEPSKNETDETTMKEKGKKDSADKKEAAKSQREDEHFNFVKPDTNDDEL